MPLSCKRSNTLVEIMILVAVQVQVNEDAVMTVALGFADRLEVDGHDALAVLASRFGDQLFEPGPHRR